MLINIIGFVMAYKAAIAEGKPFELLIIDMHFSVNGKDNLKAGLYFYNRSRDLNWDFKELLEKLR